MPPIELRCIQIHASSMCFLCAPRKRKAERATPANSRQRLCTGLSSHVVRSPSRIAITGRACDRTFTAIPHLALHIARCTVHGDGRKVSAVVRARGEEKQGSWYGRVRRRTLRQRPARVAPESARKKKREQRQLEKRSGMHRAREDDDRSCTCVNEAQLTITKHSAQ